jgi:capsule polysaccharide export protein KpsE/RkpR
LNRRERRLYEKEQKKKVNRKIDWNKISKLFKQMLLICFATFLIIISFSYYVINNQNNIRKTVASSPKSTYAKVLSISGKGVHSAYYEFVVDGNKIEGSTFNSYKGEVGDEICIEYSSNDPSINLYCNEKEFQEIKKDVFQNSFEILGFMIIAILGVILFQLIIGNKKLTSEMTTK